MSDYTEALWEVEDATWLEDEEKYPDRWAMCDGGRRYEKSYAATTPGELQKSSPDEFQEVQGFRERLKTFRSIAEETADNFDTFEDLAEALEIPLDPPDEKRHVNPHTGGEKGRKLAEYALMPVKPWAKVAQVYGEGSRKYEARNWERGYEWSLSYSALHRHLSAFWGGESIDPDSGCHHLASVVFHALALMEFEETHPELDDRSRNL